MPEWTPAQKNAITAKGGTVLVSAAAGSGKTAVLVERVIKILLNEANPIDVNRLLIVTFTNAAAAEMRERIGKALRTQIALQPENQHLLRQQMLLSGAKICTIDAFCKDLVQENFYKLQIAQDFRILDDSEKKVMEEETAAAVLEMLYNEEAPSFLSLVELLSSSRNDDALNYYIIKLHDYIMAHPFPEQWLDYMAGLYAAEQPVGDTVWAELIREHTFNALNHAKEQLRDCCRLLEQDAVLYEKVKPVVASDLQEINALLACNTWDEMIAGFQKIIFVRFPSIRGYADDPLKTQIVSIRKEVKKNVEALQDLYCADQAEHGTDMNRLAPIVASLAQAVMLFHKELMQRKLEENALSFSDIEHFALKLLVQPCDGNVSRTDLANALMGQYDYILIDEYQDTNRAQDMLFRALSRDDNLFMVGDVKQSIYRFRQAMPQIFMEKKDAFVKYDGVNYPAQIVLDQNFRSRKEICSFINFVFGLLFSKEVGELEYNNDEMLHSGAVYPQSEQAPVGLYILKAHQIDTKETDLYEAQYLAQLIQTKIRNGEFVTEKNGAVRKVCYGDFAVLFRSASTHIPNYIKIFRQYGIPVCSQAGTAFFDTPEISTMLSLLRVLDNPMQDVPLLSVMMSPLFGFTPDELSLMRIADRKSALYTCVANYARQGDVKTKRFFSQMDRLRTYSVTMPSGAFVRKVYDETSYTAIAKSMGEPDQRLANLNLLLEYADYFENSGKKGLSAFIRFLDKISWNNQKLDGANIQNDSGNGVKMMSIHRSKGLEFPICIIAGNSRKYNNAALRENLLLHPELGVGLKVHNKELLYQYNTVPYNAVKLAIKNAEMSENLRVLYVAMTRAKEQLILLITENNLERKLAKLSPAVAAGCISSYVVGNAACDGDLLLCCALLHPDAGALRMLSHTDICTKPSDFSLELKVIDPLAEDNVVQETEKQVPADPELVKEIKERLSYVYPYKRLAAVAAKRNASSLDEKETDFSYFAASCPGFLSDEGLSAAQKGSAMHAFMQHCDYHKAKEDITGEADRMEACGYLSRVQRSALAEKKLDAFFHSDFAQRIFRADQVMREIKFAAFLPAGEVYSELGECGEKVYIQGIADCVFIENGQMVVVDYKTDHVKKEEVLLERYKNQLHFYCKALSHTYKMPVKACYLYSFYLDKPLQYDFI